MVDIRRLLAIIGTGYSVAIILALLLGRCYRSLGVGSFLITVALTSLVAVLYMAPKGD